MDADTCAHTAPSTCIQMELKTVDVTVHFHVQSKILRVIAPFSNPRYTRVHIHFDDVLVVVFLIVY